MAKLGERYANALFELAAEKGLLDEYLEQSLFLRETLNKKDCLNIINHPQISTIDKRTFFKNVFEGNIHSDLLGFLYLVVSKNREDFLIPALTSFIEKVEKEKGKVKAEVVSADLLDEEQITRIKQLLSNKLNKQVDILPKIDPTLIGGFCIYVEGYFIDCSIKKQLNEMVDFIKRSAPNDSET